MNKRIVSLLMSVVMILSMLVTAVPVYATSTNGLNISATKGSAEETFTVTLNIPAVTNVLENTEFNITFDNTAFEVTEAPVYSGITGGTATLPTAAEVNINGYYSLNLLGTDIKIGEGAALTAQFKVKEGAAFDSYDFKLAKAAVSYTDEILGTPIYALQLADFNPTVVTYTVTENISEPVTGGLSLSVTEGSADDVFTVTLNIPAVENILENTQFKVVFDNTVFEVIEAPAYSGITGGSVTLPTADEVNTNGYYSLNLLGTDIIIGEKAMLTANFKVKNRVKAGTYDFSLKEAAVSYTDETLGTPIYALQLTDFKPTTVVYTVKDAVSESIPATEISLNSDTLTLTEGNTATLTVTLTPADTTDKVVWSSSNEDIATVDENGVVTAVAEGTATITAKANDTVSATCTVTVEKAACTHENQTTHPAVSSTCNTLGNNLYYTCNDCPKVFKADGITETTVEAETLTEYGEHVEATPATCTVQATCEVCGKSYGELKAHDFTEKLEDAAHIASDGDCQTVKTYYYDCANCDQKGTEVFESQTYGDHNISEAWTTENGKHFHECTVEGCDYIEDEAECGGGTATCTAPAVCSVCLKEYGELADHDYKTEWNQGDENGHWHDCKNCSAHDTQQAHIPGAEATEDTAQTCTECGYVIAPATGHIKHTADTSKWLYDATQHWHKCIGCDEKMDIENHHGGTATCTELAICEDCLQPYGELKAHDFTEKLEDADHLASAGDCQTLKTYYYDCADCDLKGTETFEGTAYGEHDVSEAWTTENGKHFHECTVEGCDYIEDEAECGGGTATCTAPAVCSVCLKEYGELADHDYKTEWNQGDENGHWHDCKNCSAHDTQQAHIPGAEATEDTAQTCTECGYVIVPATGHITHTADESEWLYNADQHWHKCVGCDMKLDVENHSGGTATCEAKAVCEVCGQAYGELADHVDEDSDELCDECSGDMHKHSYAEKWSMNSEKHWHECECGDKADEDAHTAGKWIVDKEATSDTEGQRHIECIVCGYVMAVETIPVTDIGFDYDEWYWHMMSLMNQKYTITANAGEGGSISNEGRTTVKFSNNITYTITPDEGYEIEAVYVDNVDVGAVESYTFKRVNKDHTIHAVFAEIEEESIYADIEADDWFYDDVVYVTENGLMNGTGENKFSPDVNTTRAMIVTILWRLEGEDEAADAGFTDVAADMWYTEAIDWAAANGIVNGFGDGTFGPEKNITREQVMAILHRYAAYKGWDDGLAVSMIPQFDCSVWAENDVNWADMNGLLDNLGVDVIDMTAEADRAEIAAYLRRFCENIAE